MSVESAHEESINDCQFDYYGNQIASCDNNGFVQITTLKSSTTLNSGSIAAGGNNQQANATGSGEAEIEDQQSFQAHNGPAWSVAWSHPRYESLLASCGYDNKVKVFKKQQGSWSNVVFEKTLPASVNCISWAPQEYGMILAAGTAQGLVHIFKRNSADGTWPSIKFVAHQESVTSLSWASCSESSQDSKSTEDKEMTPLRLATGGNDKQVKLWTFFENEFSNPQEETIGTHSDWVRDVAWCPNPTNQNSHSDMVASCSEDKQCFVWVNDAQKESSNSCWSKKIIELASSMPVYQVSWSEVGNLLAVAGGDNQVQVFAEDQDGNWLDSQLLNTNQSTSQ